METCMEILTHFENILYGDARKLNSIFNTDKFLIENKDKIRNKPFSVQIYDDESNIGKVSDKLNKISNEIKEIEDEINKTERNDNSYEYQIVNEIIDNIANQQNEIDLLTKNYKKKKL